MSIEWARTSKLAVALMSLVVLSTAPMSASADTKTLHPAEESFRSEHPGLELDFPMDLQEVRNLPEGKRSYFAVGRVTNTSDVEQEIPMILVLFRDAKERVVFTSEFQAPQSTVAPGQVLEVLGYTDNIPEQAKYADIGWTSDDPKGKD